MKRNNIFAWCTAFAMAFAFATPANAQFGGLLKKAKDAVKKSVEKEVDKGINKGSKSVSDAGKAAVMSATGIADLSTLHKCKFNPSKEALAADSFANNETVPKDFTKSYKQLHAAYEHLDPRYFPLQPYYKYPYIYCLGEQRLEIPWIHFIQMMSTFLKMPIGSDDVEVDIVGPTPATQLVTADGQKLGLHRDELYRYPMAARFFADPNCKESVWNLAMLLVSDSRRIGMVRKYKVSGSAGVADAEKGWMFPYSISSVQYERESLMKQMACTVVDINLIGDCVLNLYKSMETEKNAVRKAIFLIGANEMHKNILLRHKDFDDNANKFNQQVMYYTRYYNTPEYSKIMDAPVVVPEPETITLKPGAMNKQLNAQILRIIREKEPDIIRVVVINDSWMVHTLKDRSVMAWAVYKNKKGKLEAHDYSFCQDYMGGGKYGSLRYKGIGMRTVYVK
jgi:hypothetical protein